MSTVFLIKCDGIETPYGFSRLNNSTFTSFESNQYGKTNTLAQTSEGEIVFSNDYPNKREYLKKIKSKGWKQFSGYFHLKEETLFLLKAMGDGTIFSLIDISDHADKVKDCEKISLTKLNARTILQYGKYYVIVK